MVQPTVFRRPLGVADFERMNLPEEFWKATVQSVPESVRDTVRRYLLHIDVMLSRPAGLLLSGSAGVGKSAIAALVCKEARSRGYTGYFTTLWELRESIRARLLFDDEQSLLERCRSVDVLVLDGLRSEDAPEQILGRRTLEELITTRGARKKATFVTTPLDALELRQAFGGLMESVQGCMVYLPVAGPNLRREKNDELRKAVLGS